MIFLENEYLKASFVTKGAELQSLVHKKNGINYLWSGDPAYWGKFSPVLFPIVGALKNNTYYFDGQSYQLSRHGFARDYNFRLAVISDSEIVFKLCHNEETLKIYPFEFTLQLRYSLNGPALTCSYEVNNPSGRNSMLFSIGGHPAFAIPVNQTITYDDYYLQFNNDSELKFHKITQDLIDDEIVTLPLTSGKLPLHHQLFYDDAMVFKQLKSDCISLRNNKNEHGLHFRFKGFPFFGIWAAKDADFVCLEPWCGIADGIGHQQDLRKKEGIIELAPLETWSRNWETVCF